MVQIKYALGGIPVSRAMLTDFRILSPTDRLEEPVNLLLQGNQQDFPVVFGDEIVGVLTRSDLLNGLAKSGPDATVQEYMRREFVTADPLEMLENAFARLQQCDCHTMPVVQNGKLVGLLTSDNLGEFMMVQSALQQRKRGPVTP